MASPSMIYLRRFSPNGKLFSVGTQGFRGQSLACGHPLCIDCGIYAVDPVSVSANWIIGNGVAGCGLVFAADLPPSMDDLAELSSLENGVARRYGLHSFDTSNPWLASNLLQAGGSVGGVQSAAGRKLGRCACDLRGCGAKWSEGTTEPRLGRAKRFPALSF